MGHRDPTDVAWYDEELAKVAVDGAPRPLTAPIEIQEYDASWPGLFAREEARIRAALGDQIVRIEHVGSTSVPGLAAKPILDIALEVPDATDEEAYVPALERAGYTLRIREPEWFEHRGLRGRNPNVNLHVFSAGCEEVDRMVVFRNRLRADRADRELYAAKKRELAARDWTYAQQYADAKTEVVLEILSRAEV